MAYQMLRKTMCWSEIRFTNAERETIRHIQCTAQIILVEFFASVLKPMGFENSARTLEIRVLVGIGRSGMLRGRILT